MDEKEIEIYKDENYDIDFRKQWSDIIQCISSVAATIQPTINMIAEVASGLNKAFRNVENFLNEVAKIDFTFLGEGLEEKYKKKVIYIGEELQKKNWYLARYSMGNIVDIEKCLKNGEEIDTLMQRIVDREVDEIEEKLILRFPNRAGILEDAFMGYRAQVYNLCIPAFLAQIEGICNDVLGVNFFSKDYKKMYAPKTKAITLEKLENIEASKIAQGTVMPLCTASAMFNKVENKSVLNRHNILHGYSCEYGNKLNADQCISLLGFLMNVDKVLNNKVNEKNM